LATTTETWDPGNNITETTDARGNPTDYSYDANGNTLLFNNHRAKRPWKLGVLKRGRSNLPGGMSRRRSRVSEVSDAARFNATRVEVAFTGTIS
jgi:hypothetical protein